VTPVQLVCFHHAGGGPTAFTPLLRGLGDDIRVVTVKLPGRDVRANEPRLVDATECVRLLANELAGTLARPHVFLGHSMGAILAYSLPQQRITAGLPAPEAVIVVANRAPHLRRPGDELERADDAELAADLVRCGGLPAKILSRPDWLQQLMPVIRDDLRVVFSYRYSGEPPLSCPLHIFGGRDDPLASPDELHAWSKHSTQAHPVRLFDSGHFLFRRPDPALIAAIRGVVDHANRNRNRKGIR
jgi:surfactin synthase thioesterase subunit